MNNVLTKELCLSNIQNLTEKMLLDLLEDEKYSVIITDEQHLKEEKEVCWQRRKATLQRVVHKTTISIRHKREKISARLEIGTVNVEERVFSQCDLYISYTKKNIEQVEKFLGEVLKKSIFVLVEPNIWERASQLAGYYQPLISLRYQRDDIKTALDTHLFWQIFLINQGWVDFLCKPLERITLRQLRVKLRRLRSCLAFFKPVLEQPQASLWQTELRRQGEELSLLRELDVALMAIEKFSANTTQEELAQEYLAKILSQARAIEAKRVKQKMQLATLTFTFARLIMWLSDEPLTASCERYGLESFFRRRIREWSKNIISLTQRYPDFSDVEKMHKIRIKVKKFRYVMMSFPEINHNTNTMLRRLKKLQDMLGFLHDEYINKELAQRIMQADGSKTSLKQTVFCGWESAKTAEALAIVPDLWEDFCEDLELWRDTI
ncbi:MAG TPA: CHAD domain-containing protein [Candidatus Avacidaminococcus intestinavium]|uniref:CHAD domain-containing protein n=1 Tax=Candidatus Avacidaminococcus intestinavium TaxID=2840684 RepID=A0A9D1SLB2_9FIRM|nr:CHAD domain-containing protein [Candidatus Avacidaminococcus intestinavium]